MKEPSLLILLSFSACAFSAPPGALSSPALKIQARFDEKNIKEASGLVNIQSGPVSLVAARGTEGKIALGGSLFEKGHIPLGNLGRISLKAMSTMEGMYQALVDSEIYYGQSSFSPFQLTVMRTTNGLQYSGTANLGILGGTYEGSDGSFVLNFDTNGWVTAMATGSYRDKQIKWKGYNASVNFGAVSAAINMDNQMTLLDYDVGGVLGIFHGTVHKNQVTKGTSYRGGVNLGIINLEAIINEDKSHSFATHVDTGMLRLAYNADPAKADYNWSGTLNMANLEIDCAHNKEGYTLGGRIQVGSSVVTVHRDPKGIYTVKVDKGMLIE